MGLGDRRAKGLRDRRGMGVSDRRTRPGGARRGGRCSLTLGHRPSIPIPAAAAPAGLAPSASPGAMVHVTMLRPSNRCHEVTLSDNRPSVWPRYLLGSLCTDWAEYPSR